MSRNSSLPTITVLLRPIDNASTSSEVLDPRFERRPALTMCYPPPTKEPKEMPLCTDSAHDSLERAQGLYPLSLGRNVLTRIHDTKLSRLLASLEFRNQPAALVPVLMIKVNQANQFHKVCLNGARILMDEVPLINNDKIGLHGEKYRYQVHLLQGNSQSAAPNPSTASNFNPNVAVAMSTVPPSSSGGGSGNGGDAANINASFQTVASNEASSGTSTCAHTPNHSQDTCSEPQETLDNDNGKRQRSEMEMEMEESTLDKIQATARQHILDDVTCSICMEILVHTHVANPCGHIFCKSCIERIPSVPRKRYMTKSCPTCRKEITSLSWARSYDNIIWNMVLMGEIFGDGMHGEEDLNQYLLRCGRSIDDLSEEEKACIYQRCKKKKRRRTDFNGPLGLKLGGPKLETGVHQDSDSASNSSDIDMFAMGGIGDGINLSFSPSPSSRLFRNFGFPVVHHLNLAHASLLQRNEGLDGPSGTVEDPICLDD